MDSNNTTVKTHSIGHGMAKAHVSIHLFNRTLFVTDSFNRVNSMAFRTAVFHSRLKRVERGKALLQAFYRSTSN